MSEQFLSKTIVLCQDREFHQRALGYLTDHAISRESTHLAKSLMGVRSLLGPDQLFMNLLIDGNDFLHLLTEPDLRTLSQWCEVPGHRILIYVPENNLEPAYLHHGFSTLFVRPLPFASSDFRDAFHRDFRPVTEVTSLPELVPIESSAEGLNFAKAKHRHSERMQAADETAIEAFGHVRSSLAMLRLVEQNRAAVDQIFSIGQVFNGIIGACAYFEDLEAGNILRDLAQMIDQIARYYERQKIRSISDKHFELLAAATQTAHALLLEVSEGRTVPEGSNTTLAAIQAAYLAHPELGKKTSHSQAEADRLIAGFRRKRR